MNTECGMVAKTNDTIQQFFFLTGTGPAKLVGHETWSSIFSVSSISDKHTLYVSLLPFKFF